MVKSSWSGLARRFINGPCGPTVDETELLSDGADFVTSKSNGSPIVRSVNDEDIESVPEVDGRVS